MTEQPTTTAAEPTEVTATPSTTTPKTGEKGEKGEKIVKAKKKKVVKQVPRANAYIQASYNNTLVTLTDLNGAVLSWSSAGVTGFKGPKKATPYAASTVVKDLMTKAAPYNVKEVNVFIKGIGGGRESAIRAFHINGLNVLAITDTTPIPHNGCRPPKRRRV